MNAPSYQQYCSDPAIRAAIEADVRRQRHEAAERWIWQPLIRALRAPFARRIPSAAPQAMTAAR